jgi:arylsulfatase
VEGVLFAIGDIARGFCAFVKAGELVIHFTNGIRLKRDLRLPIAPGQQFLRFSHKAEGGMRGKASVTLDNPEQKRPVEGELNMSPVILKLHGEGLDVGLDRLRKVCAEYEGRGTFAYQARIDWLKIEPGPQAPGSIVNIAEELAQKDW